MHILLLVTDKQYSSMDVIDLYNHNGDRLTFLSNTHMLVEGRHRKIKFGLLAQLIEYLISLFC